MIFRALDATGDWVFGMGAGSYAQGNQAIGLNIQTRVLSWMGNCFFSLQDFIDWANLLAPGQLANIKLAVDTVILQSFGVTNLLSSSIQLDRLTRRVTITYSVSTIYSRSFVNTINLTPVFLVAS